MSDYNSINPWTILPKILVGELGITTETFLAFGFKILKKELIFLRKISFHATLGSQASN